MTKRNIRILAIVLFSISIVLGILGYFEKSYREETLKSLDLNEQIQLLKQEGIPVDEYSFTKGNLSIASWNSSHKAIFTNKKKDKKFFVTFTKSLSSPWKIKNIKWEKND